MSRASTSEIPSLYETTQSLRSFSKEKKIIVAIISISMFIIFLHVLMRGSPVANSPLSDKYKLLLIADRDEFSYNDQKKNWESVLLRGNLWRRPEGGYSFTDHDSVILSQELVRKTRGMELSELKFFSPQSSAAPIWGQPKRLLAFDDRSGIVYEISNWSSSKPGIIPRSIVSAGNGWDSNTLKNEWATVKDGKLFVGSWGKEFTSRDGTKVISAEQMMYVKLLDNNLGIVEHRNWIPVYEKLRNAVGIQFPGYLVHEAVEWSNTHKKWFFLPRRVSAQKYDDEQDLQRGGNILLIASEDFSSVTKIDIQQLTEKTRGFSSFKFIPGTNDREIIALKTEENGQVQKSYLTIFDIDGNVILPETFIGNEKFEGLEIVYDN